MMDNTLAFEFVEGEIKVRQFNTITQWNWDLTCQKKWIEEIWGKIVARILQFTFKLVIAKIK